MSNALASVCWLYTRMAGSRSDTENGNLDEHKLTTWNVCFKRADHHINFLLALLLLLSTNWADAVSITYGPFAWPLDPSDGGYPTSAKVIWWTDSATSSNTAYVGTTPSGPWTYTGVDPTQSTRHEALITGLAGGATYYLYVTSNAVSSSVVQFRTGKNELMNGSFESWHSVSGQDWGTEEPDGWHGWEIYPWSPPGSNNPDHIAISKDRNTGIPSPLTKDGSHRVGMDEGWRSCYGGIYQEVTGLAPGTYTFSGWVAWLFEGIAYPSKHRVEIIVKDGQHVPGEIPTGYVVFGQDGTASDQTWRYVQASVVCASGTLTVYANLRSDNWDGKSFAHFDAFRVMSESEPAVRFSNFQSTCFVNGNAYDITLTYDTDIPTTTQIEWGPSTSYGNTSSLNPELVTHHVVQLMSVPPSAAPYHYRALATTPGDISEFSGDQTFDAPEIVLSGISSSVDMQTGTICTIRWATNYGTTTNKVCYRRVGETDYSEVLESDSTPHTDHVVSLTGLRCYL